MGRGWKTHGEVRETQHEDGRKPTDQQEGVLEQARRIEPLGRLEEVLGPAAADGRELERVGERALGWREARQGEGRESRRVVDRDEGSDLGLGRDGDEQLFCFSFGRAGWEKESV